MTSSPLVVALLGDLPAPQLEVLRAALPGAEVRDAHSDPDALRSARWIVTRDEAVDEAVLGPGGGAGRRGQPGGGQRDRSTRRAAPRGIDVHEIASPALATVAEHTLHADPHALQASPGSHAVGCAPGVVAGGVEPALTTQESYAYNWVGLERFEGLRGKTVGLVGLGVIGSKTAHLLRAFGVDVAYTKPRRLPPEQELAAGVRFLPLPDLLGQSHCVSLHNRFTPETERMMGEREFALMRQGSFFVNTARGRLVDEKALAAALERGHLAGAALDVFWYEPLPKDSPLLDIPNLILTPHTGGIPMAEARIIELQEAAHLIMKESA